MSLSLKNSMNPNLKDLAILISSIQFGGKNCNKSFLGGLISLP
jgi:hypothetical protein